VQLLNEGVVGDVVVLSAMVGRATRAR